MNSVVPSLLLGSAASLGLAWAAWQAVPRQRSRLVNAGLAALAGALLFGRLGYVLLNLAQFEGAAWGILAVWQGGLEWSAALAGGGVSLALYCALRGEPFGSQLDGLAPLVASLALAGWLECWLRGCAYGLPSAEWWALPAPDEWGVLQKRLPLQLLGMISAALSYWLVEALRRPAWHAGTAGALTGLLVSLAAGGLSLLRADLSPLWYGFRQETWLAGALALAALALILYLYLRR